MVKLCHTAFVSKRQHIQSTFRFLLFQRANQDIHASAAATLYIRLHYKSFQPDETCSEESEYRTSKDRDQGRSQALSRASLSPPWEVFMS